MHKLLIALAAAAATTGAIATPACHDLTLGVNLGTYHFQRDSYREFNPGVYANCDGITAGVYVNSASKPTWWAGYTAQVGPIAITAGAGTGYRLSQSDPVLAPILIFTIKLPGGLRLGVFPRSGEKSGGMHLSKEF